MEKNEMDRRTQLSEFLKGKRARIRPADVGLVQGPRRRTPGLRREEVADLAGVGHVWYTWLEQARSITPSVELLERLANTLKMDRDERIYLFRLARPQIQAINPDGLESVPRSVVEMIQSLDYKPAYVRNLRWDLLACNVAHTRVFGDYSSVPIEQRNMLWLIFTDQRIRATSLNWETVASHVVARFRADLSRIPEDSRACALKNRLLKISPDFARLWKQYCTTETLSHPVEINHPDAGVITLQRVTLRTESEPAQNVIIYTPQDSRSIARVRRICGRGHDMQPRPR